MQLPQERDEESYPVVLWYRTAFEMASLPQTLKLLVDGFSGSGHTLYINGTAVRDTGQRSALDAEIREIDIRPFVKPGRNVVAVQLVVERRTDGLLDLLKLVGNFALEKRDDSWIITTPGARMAAGDWCAQGYPFFSGTGCYTFKFDLPASYDSGKLFLEAECGEDVLEVVINEHQPVVLPWHPYCLDTTGLLHPGRNTVLLKVTNTLINIFEGVSKPSGLLQEPLLRYKPRYTF